MHTDHGEEVGGVIGSLQRQGHASDSALHRPHCQSEGENGAKRVDHDGSADVAGLEAEADSPSVTGRKNQMAVPLARRGLDSL